MSTLLLSGVVALAYLLLRPSQDRPVPLVDHLGGTKRQVAVRCEAPRGRTRRASEVGEYLGVPYARLDGPSGRFAEATLVQYVPGMALRTGGVPACPQYPWSPVHRLPNIESTESDDCLYLNIWRPGRAAASTTGRTQEGRCGLRPVVLMLHGGRFQFGGGGTYVFYDGARAAALWDVLVVVPAYRVGAFGFLNMRVPDAPGNVGLLDQALALKWVHRYIHHFGGDKQRLTLLGQDVGATSIGFHLARNETPFQRAILMSGSPFSLLPSNSGIRAVVNANALAGILGCGAQDVQEAAERERAVQCLRKRSIAATIQAADQLATSSDLTVYVPSATRDLPWVLGGPMYSKAMLRNIDFLVGVSRDEGTMHVSELLQVLGLSADQTLTPRRLLSVFRSFLESYGIPDADPVVQHYGFNRTGLLDETLGQLFLLEMARPVGDFLIYCPTLFFLEEVLNASGRAFVYEFVYTPSYRTWPTWQGVPQFVDFVFATGLLDVLDTIQPASTQDRKVARDLTKVFAGFVNTGNPNTLPNTIWRRWSHSVDAPLSLDYNVGSAYRLGTSLSRKANCNFWRTYF